MLDVQLVRNNINVADIDTEVQVLHTSMAISQIVERFNCLLVILISLCILYRYCLYHNMLWRMPMIEYKLNNSKTLNNLFCLAKCTLCYVS